LFTADATSSVIVQDFHYVLSVSFQLFYAETFYAEQLLSSSRRTGRQFFQPCIMGDYKWRRAVAAGAL
jgi:hypothetical protein